MSKISAGICLMMLATFVGPLIDVFSKLATTTDSPMVITTARFMVQSLCMLPLVISIGLWRTFSMRMSVYHAIRAILLVLAMLAFVVALAVMNLADAIALFFVEPILATVMSGALLRESIGWRRYAACFVGFGGALIVIRPNFQQAGYIALLPILAAFFFAANAIVTKALVHREDPWAMQFQMSLWAVTMCLILLIAGHFAQIKFLMPSWPNPTAFVWMLSAGVSAASSGLLSVYAYRAAPVSVLAPLTYLEIVSGTLLGWVVFGAFPEPITWTGILIIIGAGAYIAVLEHLGSDMSCSDPQNLDRS